MYYIFLSEKQNLKLKVSVKIIRNTYTLYVRIDIIGYVE